MTIQNWNAAPSMGEPFWSVVKPNGNVVAMRVTSEEYANQIARLPELEAAEQTLAELRRVLPPELAEQISDELIGYEYALDKYACILRARAVESPSLAPTPAAPEREEE